MLLNVLILSHVCILSILNMYSMQETWVQTLGWEDPWRRERLPTPIFWPGEFHRLYRQGGRIESETTE